jgi:hypothetical protein
MSAENNKENLASQICFRDATIDDIPRIEELLKESWIEHARQEPDMLDEDTMRREDVEKYYKDGLSDPTNTFIRIAEIGGQLVGVLRADIKNIEPFFKHQKVLWLDDVVVLKQFRRKRIIDQLLKEFERIAMQNNIEQTQLRVYSYNIAMQTALIRNGYHSPHSLFEKTFLPKT